MSLLYTVNSICLLTGLKRAGQF